MLKFIAIALASGMLVSCGHFQAESPTPSVPVTNGLILAIGDSLTAGLGLPPEDSYPAQLERRLREEWYAYKVQNAGISGDTSAELLARLDWILQWDTPSFAILEIGANDAFQALSPEDLEKNMRAALLKFKDKNIPVFFTGMKAPYNLGTTYRQQFEEVYAKLAKEFEVPFMPFFLEGVALDPKLNQGDRIHPNREWYSVVVENMIPLLEKYQLIKK